MQRIGLPCYNVLLIRVNKIVSLEEITENSQCHFASSKQKDGDYIFHAPQDRERLFHD